MIEYKKIIYVFYATLDFLRSNIAKEEHDQEVMQSIKNVNGINKISKERIFDELKKFFL